MSPRIVGAMLLVMTSGCLGGLAACSGAQGMHGVCACEVSCEYDTGLVEMEWSSKADSFRVRPVMGTHATNWVFADGRAACVDFCPCDGRASNPELE